MKLYRSMLFVPGHRGDWIAKAPKYGADALLLDLEDGCPSSEKLAARSTVRFGITDLTARGTDAFVRINALDTNMASDDLEAVTVPGLRGVMIPKLENAAQVLKVDAWLEHFERRADMPQGSVRILAMPETALGIKDAHALIAATPRVACVVNGAGSRAGDITRAIGYKWTPEGDETSYVLQHILLANRAAGVEYPLSAGVLEVTDLEQTRRQMLRVRAIGYRGMVLIHPTAVGIANELFAPAPEEIAWHKGVIAALVEGEKQGRSAVTYDGMMVDYAHARNALELIEQARSFGIDVGDVPELKLPA